MNSMNDKYEFKFDNFMAKVFVLKNASNNILDYGSIVQSKFLFFFIFHFKPFLKFLLNSKLRILITALLKVSSKQKILNTVYFLSKIL